MQDVAVLKETTELTVAKLAKDVKEASQDSAERAHFLSRYIDEEIIKIGQKSPNKSKPSRLCVLN